jgi:hypothetical protein
VVHQHAAGRWRWAGVRHVCCCGWRVYCNKACCSQVLRRRPRPTKQSRVRYPSFCACDGCDGWRDCARNARPARLQAAHRACPPVEALVICVYLLCILLLHTPSTSLPVSLNGQGQTVSYLQPKSALSRGCGCRQQHQRAGSAQSRRLGSDSPPHNNCRQVRRVAAASARPHRLYGLGLVTGQQRRCVCGHWPARRLPGGWRRVGVRERR